MRSLRNMYIDNDASAGHGSMGLQAMQAWGCRPCKHGAKAQLDIMLDKFVSFSKRLELAFVPHALR